VFFGWGPPAQPGTDPRDAPTDDSELVGSLGRVPGVMFVSAAALIAGGLLDGARPGAFEAAQRTAAAFADREVYAAAVLGRPLPSAEPIEYLHVTPLAVGLSVFTVLATLALCAVLLERPRLPFAIPAAIRRGTDAGCLPAAPSALRAARRLRRLGDRRVRRARRIDRGSDMNDVHEI